MTAEIVYPHCPETGGPLPLLNVKYGGSIDSFVARTKMDTGEFRQRQRYSKQQETVKCTLILSHLEMEYWRNWTLYALKQGTLPFFINLPIGGDINIEEQILIQKELRIVGGKWKHVYADFMFHRVTFTGEFLDTSTISGDIFSVYIDLGDPLDPCDAFDLAAFELAVANAIPRVAVLDNYTRNILGPHVEVVTYLFFGGVNAFEEAAANQQIAVDILDNYTRNILGPHVTI